MDNEKLLNVLFSMLDILENLDKDKKQKDAIANIVTDISDLQRKLWGIDHE